MINQYQGVITRFLHENEQLILSKENKMPLVIEAADFSDFESLQEFLLDHSEKLLIDIAKYGAILLRGFSIDSVEHFEKAMLSIKGFKGINEVFMSEYGRNIVNNSKYVLHTNSYYKTGGTLSFGNFHNENHRSPDVPSYICFYCDTPSTLGGETGLVNMEKVYQNMSEHIKQLLEEKAVLTTQWPSTLIAERYKLSTEKIEEYFKKLGFSIVDKNNQRFIEMYKPLVFECPITKQRSLHTNLYEIPGINQAIRKEFKTDYRSMAWFWHRLYWNALDSIERLLPSYSVPINFILSVITSCPLKDIPKTIKFIVNILKQYKKMKSEDLKLTSYFDQNETDNLARLMKRFYSSCLWRKGDILLVDNRKVMHTGMPGAGQRKLYAMIFNPIKMQYSSEASGCLFCEDKLKETIGSYLSNNV